MEDSNDTPKSLDYRHSRNVTTDPVSFTSQSPPFITRDRHTDRDKIRGPYVVGCVIWVREGNPSNLNPLVITVPNYVGDGVVVVSRPWDGSLLNSLTTPSVPLQGTALTHTVQRPAHDREAVVSRFYPFTQHPRPRSTVHTLRTEKVIDKHTGTRSIN